MCQVLTFIFAVNLHDCFTFAGSICFVEIIMVFLEAVIHFRNLGVVRNQLSTKILCAMKIIETPLVDVHHIQNGSQRRLKSHF